MTSGTLSLAGAGRFLILFALPFLGLGLWTGLQHYEILRSWPEVEARGANSEVAQYRHRNRTMYRAQYDLSYTVSGKDYTTPFSSGSSSSSRGGAQREADRYGPGTTHTLRYDPSDPNDVRLHAGYSLRFFALPLIFGSVGLILLGLGVWALIHSWTRPPGPRCPACLRSVDPDYSYCPGCAARLERKKVKKDPDEEPEEITGAPAERKSRTGNRIAGMIFSLAGAAFLIAAAKAGSQRHNILAYWPEAEATVTGNELITSLNAEGRRAFRARIRFQYVVDGTEYRSAALSERSTNYVWVRRKIDRHSPGSRHAIRYNPGYPGDIRFDAGYTLEFLAVPLLLGLMGIIFAPLGLALFYLGFIRRRITCSRCGHTLVKDFKFCPACSTPAR